MAVQQNQDKVFKYLFFLPHEVRTVVVDEMNPAERCRFRRCSKICDREARASKNYIYSLGIESLMRVNRITLTFIFNPHERVADEKDGYVLKFYREEDTLKKVMIYSNLFFEEKWRDELRESTNLYDIAFLFFQRALQQYQNTIRKLDLDCWRSPFADFGVQSLKRVERLKICACHRVPYFIEKIQRPLKVLRIRNERNRIRLEDFGEKLFNVQNELRLERCNITNEQLLRMTTPRIEMFIGDLTPEDIRDFVTSWLQWESRSDNFSLSWKLTNSEFNLLHLYTVMRLERRMTGYLEAELQHYERAGKIGKLLHSAIDRTLTFVVTNQEPIVDDSENII